jgi:hypothetical protein
MSAAGRVSDPPIPRKALPEAANEHDTDRPADRLAFSDMTVRRFLDLHNIPVRVRNTTLVDDIDRHQLADLRRRGLTNREIADQLAYSKRRVERAL